MLDSRSTISGFFFTITLTSFLSAVPHAHAQNATVDQQANTSGQRLVLTIDRAVELGLERNFRVQRSNRNSEIAELQVDSARAGLRPRFDSHGRMGQTQNYSEYRGSAYRFSDLNPDFSANVYAVASLPIDLWGVTRRQVEQSEYARRVTDLSRDQTELDVMAEIRGNYIRALRAQERTRAYRESVAAIDALIAKAARRQPSVVPFLESEREIAAQELDESEASNQLALSSLSQSMRLPRTTQIALAGDMPPPAPVPSHGYLIELAEQNRTDLGQAKIRLDQARLSREQADDFRRPRIGIDAYADQGLTGRSPLLGDRDSGRSISLGVSLNLTVPLIQYDGGVLRNSRKVADIQADQALADYTELLENASNEVSQLLITIESASSRLKTLPDTVLAQNSLEHAEQQMLSSDAKDAAALLAQVANARENLDRAKIAKIDTLAEFNSSYILLQRAIGANLGH